MFELSRGPILPEVRRQMDQGKEPIKVIISIQEGKLMEEVLQELKKKGIRDIIDHTDYYISANMKIKELKRLEKMTELIDKIWLDKKMSAMLKESIKTIKAEPAWKVFGVSGAGICWAVIDTGIDRSHKDLKDRVDENQYDFSGEGAGDKVGHGTHVAGIIAGIAPEVKLYDFKVLGVDGGTSFSVIKAMHKIREINFGSPQMVIHGANLSLGGSVPVGSYGCGFSPECQEANRLVLSGVVVCVAASNDGHKILATITSNKKLEYFPTFMDLGISDPGNAEHVITVGSTHKTHPHQYGISFFSSKGPTGDGRFKPDVVAPGEKISSTYLNNGYAELSGTSMATPHVSGAIALFLSAKKEFIGHPLDVKRILMDTCIDLKRDRYFQGAGLIDIFRMIQSV
ncbi:TPA: peptidase S8 [bacterium]|nr:peptidase S8 [bacterium]